MRITENACNIKVNGHIGTWYVVASESIKDMNGVRKMVFALEHEEHGDEANPLFVNSEGKELKELEGFLCLSDVEQDMKGNAWNYENRDGKCECYKCELKEECIHREAYRRMPRDVGGLALCKKL
jgi:predicted metal-binding protein